MVTTLLAFLVVLPGLAEAQQHSAIVASTKTINTDEQLNEWLMHYYQHPQPDLIVSAVEFMAKEGTLSKEAAQPPIAAFLAQVFAQNPDKVREWQAQLGAGPDDQAMITARALWMSNNQTQLKALVDGKSAPVATYARKLIADHPPELLSDQVSNPGFLDMLWGSFFATGDERYVRRLISVLPWLNEKSDVQKMLIGAAARWSLTSNAKQHSRVLEICEAELQTLPKEQKVAVEEIVKAASGQAH